MTTINNLTLDTPEPTAAKAFHTALGVDAHITARDADAPTTGFPGFTLSLVVSQPNIVDAYIEAALDNGGATITPAKKSLWGNGGVVQAPTAPCGKSRHRRRRIRDRPPGTSRTSCCSSESEMSKPASSSTSTTAWK